MRVMSERAADQGWRRDQTGQVIAAVAVADSHSRVVVATVGSHILTVALGNQYIVLACVVVGSLWQGYPLGGAAGRKRADSWQTDTMPVVAPVGSIVAAVAAGVAGRTAGRIRWDLGLRNRSTAAVAASQQSIGVMRELEVVIQHLSLGSEKRRLQCDL